jgi:hypothetical protein
MRPAVKTRETLMVLVHSTFTSKFEARRYPALWSIYGAIQWFSPIHSPDTTTTAIGAESEAAIDPSSLLFILSIQHVAYC